MNSTKRRQNLFVNADIQGTILRRLVKYWIVYHVALWNTLFLIAFFRHAAAALASGAPHFGVSALLKNFALEHWVMLLIPVAVFPLILRDMLRLTHQVAGPLVRFQNALRKLGNGEPVEKFNLRDGDLLTEFHAVFNEFLDRYRPAVGAATGNAAVGETTSLEGVISGEIADLCRDMAPMEKTPSRSRAGDVR
jgi:hypothetical protein